MNFKVLLQKYSANSTEEPKQPLAKNLQLDIDDYGKSFFENSEYDPSRNGPIVS